MNYYPFHLGDYAAHTGHLEPMEDLVYRRLLDLYYLREGPLPPDIQSTAKLIRARSMASDVESVLNEFFVLTEDGWRHTRCDEEIAKMQDKQAKARASAAASVNARRAKAERSLGSDQTNAERSLPKTQTDAELPTPTPTPTPIVKGSAEPQGDSPPAGDLGSAELLAGVEPDGPIEPPVVTIPLVDGSEFPVTEPMVADWELAYPAVDVRQQLREMRVWCNANRAQRKTARGVSAFIVRWLSLIHI